MLKVEIKDASVTTATINGKSGSFQSSSQDAWLDLPSGERRKLRVRLEKEAKPYAAGVYTIGDESFGVSQYGDLEISRIKLIAVPAQMSRVAG